MSETKRYKRAKTYDYTKSVSIDINTSFIEGFDNIIKYFLLNVVEDPTTIPQTFQRFATVLEGKKLKQPLTPVESMIFILYTVTMELKQKAREAGYEKDPDSDESYTHDEVVDGLKTILNQKGHDVDETKVKSLLDILQNKKSS